jgi:hypothetical protein
LHYGLRTMRALLVSPASVPVALPGHVR